MTDDFTQVALNEPRHGDHWTEMFNWDLFVVGKSGDTILTIEGTRPCNYPYEGIAKTRTLEEFKTFLSYKSQTPGTWARCIERNRNVSGWRKSRFQRAWKAKD